MAKLIDREKMLDKLVGMTRGETEYHQHILSKALHLVAIEPTVDAVPVVHGRWEKRTNNYVYFYACSECGEPVLRSQWGYDFFSAFCPNCGAKMDLEVE